MVPSVSPPILFTLEVNSLNLLHHLTSIYFTTVLCSKDQLRTAETRAHQPVLSHRHRRRAEAQRDERKAQCNGCKRLLKPPTAEQELSAMGMSSAEISKLGKRCSKSTGQTRSEARA